MIRLKPAVVTLVIGLAVAVPAAVLLAQNGRLPDIPGVNAPKKQAAAPPQAQPQGRPPVPVAVGKAARKPMPVRLDAIGTVQAMATVTVRSRVDSQILEVFVKDGAIVKEGDVLFKLDSRQIEAQQKQAEANLARDRAALQFAQNEQKRQEELAKRDFASGQKLETARSAAEGLTATVQGDEAAIDNMKALLSYYTIKAPISGRVGAIALKEGNIARSGDAAPALATIIQVTPIYVAFTVPQRYLPDIRTAMQIGNAKVEAIPHGYAKGAEGTFAFIDNTLDSTTGTINVRAVFENKDELLWPGALCAVRAILRMQPDAVAVPREAIQAGQTGNFVFVVDNNGAARIKPVTVDREVDGESVVTGLNGGETVVTDGQLLLTDGARVAPRGAGEQRAPQAGDGAGGGKATL
jgi:membrane fusion protein, multidrug efflux system